VGGGAARRPPQDPSFVISHRRALSDAPQAYRMFNDKADDCVKVVLDPTA